MLSFLNSSNSLLKIPSNFKTIMIFLKPNFWSMMILFLGCSSFVAAQNDAWTVVMTNGTHAESYEHKTYFPSKFIEKQWNAGQYITEMTFDGSEWWVVMGQRKYTRQAYKRSKSFPNDWIDKKWDVLGCKCLSSLNTYM